MAKFYLLLGSNVGNRIENLNNALNLLNKQVGKIIEKSAFYETEAWGLEDQPDFINMACMIESETQPQKFLETIKVIEKDLGRQTDVKWEPRTIDIDILYIDDAIISTQNLKVPHPQIYDRNFVLIPMLDIAGDFIDPVKNITLDEIYDMCTDTKEVYLYEAE